MFRAKAKVHQCVRHHKIVGFASTSKKKITSKTYDSALWLAIFLFVRLVVLYISKRCKQVEPSLTLSTFGFCQRSDEIRKTVIEVKIMNVF